METIILIILGIIWLIIDSFFSYLEINTITGVISFAIWGGLCYFWGVRWGTITSFVVLCVLGAIYFTISQKDKKHKYQSILSYFRLFLKSFFQVLILIVVVLGLVYIGQLIRG